MSQISEGIYLESKQSTLGTGHTSSNVVFRTFWAARLAGEQVEIYLLDNQLAPMGMAERLSLAEFQGKGWQHVPQLAARYEGLKDKLKPVAKAEPAAAPAQAAPTPAEAPAQAAPSPAQPKPQPKPEAKPAEQGGWWEMTSRGSNLLNKK